MTPESEGGGRCAESSELGGPSIDCRHSAPRQLRSSLIAMVMHASGCWQRAFAIAALFGLGFGPVVGSAVVEGAAALDPAISHRIDAVFADFDRSDTPGFAVGVIERGQLVYAHGFGQANLDDDIAIGPRTAFHLASLSKQFTGAAIALLVLDGKLSLDDPVAKYIPAAAKFGPDLKIMHLVYMTSGLPEYTSLKRKSGDPWYSAYYFTRDEAISAVMSTDHLLFKPGEKWAYSNINYMILTRVVEIVSGERFADFLRSRVFAPLAMTDSRVDDDSTQIVPHRAVGYAARTSVIVGELAKVGVAARSEGGYVRLMRNSPHFGGSGVFSTLEDLAHWDGEWTNPIVGGPSFVALMTKRTKFDHDKDNDLFGLVLGEFEGRRMIWYSGEDLDASTYMARFPDEGVTVVCLSNMLTGDCEGRTRKVLNILSASGRLPHAR